MKNAIISLTLLFDLFGLLLIIRGDEDQSDKNGTEFRCRKFESEHFGKRNRSIVFGTAHGRVGNHLLIYAALTQLQREFGFETFTDAKERNVITEIFRPDIFEIPVLSEAFCNVDDLKFENYVGPLEKLITDPDLRHGKLIYFYPMLTGGNVKGGFTPGDHTSKVESQFKASYEAHMRRTLKFKPEIEEKVVRALGQIAKDLKKDVKDVSYVGIHNRRTDFTDYIRQTEHLEPLEKSYFEDAMEYFREEFDNVAFVYVSDDMDWGRKNLKNRSRDLFFLGSGGPSADDVAFDLALLMHCNHTIITRDQYHET